jgi:hypothetical protein
LILDDLALPLKACNLRQVCYVSRPRCRQSLIEPFALFVEIPEKRLGHGSIFSLVQVAKRVHHVIEAHRPLQLRRPAERGRAFHRTGIRGPRGQYGAFDFGLELGMTNDIKGVSKMGEGHGCLLSSYPLPSGAFAPGEI